MHASGPAPLPDLVLYGKPGCHLCDDTRHLLRELLEARSAAGLPCPTLVERDITSNPDWQRAFSETIPVLEMAGCRLPLALRPAQLRGFLADALDAEGGEARVDGATAVVR